MTKENSLSVSEVDIAELSKLQRQEPEFVPIFQYLEEKVLPEDERQVRYLVLE